MVRDVGVAEDLAHDALVAALEQWPESGVPNNPGAWLMATAKHQTIDYFRRNKLLERSTAAHLSSAPGVMRRISMRRSTMMSVMTSCD